MARIRTIKPAFFTSEDICRCSRDARLLFIGLWTEADREGRLEDRPGQIKIRIFPAEDDVNVPSLLDELHAAGLIGRYKVGAVGVLQITGFQTHQRPHPKEPASNLPAESERAEVVPKREPMVYFIRDKSKAAVKIGVAYRPEFRLASLQTASSTPLEIVGICEGGFRVEKDLHHKLGEHRLHGEWFADNKAIDDEIERLCRFPVSMHPGDTPSSPVGREGDLESGVQEGDLGRRSGKGTEALAPARGAGLIVSPMTFHRQHGQHVDGFCDWVCFPNSSFMRFVNLVIGAGSGESAAREIVIAWARSVRQAWVGRIPGSDIFKFWDHEWEATHGSNRPGAGGGVDVLAGLR